jgi:hypothetical protein
MPDINNDCICTKSLFESYKIRLLSEYDKLEKAYHPKGVSVGTYNTPVNFNESLLTPIHRWYGYKEGFSPSFVQDFIKCYSTNKSDIIFDPFGGVGTTGLEANILGYKSYLMDVNPLGLFASTVKTHHYTDSDLNSINHYLSEVRELTDWPITISIDNQTIVRYFDTTTWMSLLKVKSYISLIDNSVVKDVFSLALLSLIEKISTHHKNGNGVKKKRIMPAPLCFHELIELLIDKVSLYRDDIINQPIKGTCAILRQSNLESYILPQKANIVLTSPPYANCFDYSKVYLTELWVGGFFNEKKDQKLFRDKSIISHVHYTWQPRNMEYGSAVVNDIVVPMLSTQTLWSKNIIPMLKGYFSDMGKFLYNLSKNLSSEAVVGIVVGNSVYGGTPIATDILLAKQAESLGYKCEKIQVYRKVIASSQQMVLLTEAEKKLVRESLVVLRWKGKKI